MKHFLAYIILFIQVIPADESVQELPIGLTEEEKGKLYIIDEFNLDKDFIESQAFAYLAIRAIKKLPISFPGTTGVSFPISGGKITGYR